MQQIIKNSNGSDKIYPQKEVYSVSGADSFISSFTPGLKMIFTGSNSPKFISFERLKNSGKKETVIFAFDVENGYLVSTDMVESKRLFIFS